jgi:hypothetical protein
MKRNEGKSGKPTVLTAYGLTLEMFILFWAGDLFDLENVVSFMGLVPDPI